MRMTVLTGAFLLLGGCAAYGGVRAPDSGAVVVSGRSERGREARYGRSVRVPPGHYPPPGECRIWYVGVPPGRQPPPAKCGALMRQVPRGAFLLYNQRAWDTEYDWREHERRHAGAVPEVVLRIMATVTR